MQKPLLWRIYYPDSTFSNLEGEPQDAPSTEVLCVKYLSKEGDWVIDAHKDYYCWNLEEEEWWGCDAAGFWQYMFATGKKVVKFGTSIPNDKFYRRMADAREDTSDGMGRIT